MGGEEGVAIGDEGWASCLVGVAATLEVATNGEPTVFDGEERGKLGPLKSVSADIDWERSFISFMARAFYHMPLGTSVGVGLVASLATEEATGGSNGGGDGKASFLCHFEAEAAPLESSFVLFFVELPPGV